MQSKQSSNLIMVSIALLDLALLTVAFYLALKLRFGSLQQLDEFVWLYYLSAPLIIFLLLRNGVLTGFRYQRLKDIVSSTVLAFVVAGVISSTVLYLTKTADYSRLVFGNYFFLAAIFVLLEKVIVKRLFERQLLRGKHNIRVALVGFGKKFEEISADLRQQPEWGVSPVLSIDPRESSSTEIISNIRNAVIDELYLVYPRGAAYSEQSDELLGRVEALGLPVRVALNFDELEEYYGQHFCTMGSQTGVMLAPHNLDPDQLLLKRFMDLLGGALGLGISALIYPFMAVAIKLDSPGPVLFSHARVGKGGRPFTIYKFRSMYSDAEQRKQALQGSNVHSGHLFKVENDPRITRVGRFIRKYSLDEFPQFWNVLKGEMSLVGTRPPTLEEVAQYEDRHFRRISIKPGLTGLWQVSGRNKITDFDQVVALDVEYIRNWNLRLDFQIILRTLLIVLLPGGQSKGM